MTTKPRVLKVSEETELVQAVRSRGCLAEDDVLALCDSHRLLRERVWQLEKALHDVANMTWDPAAKGLGMNIQADLTPTSNRILRGILIYHDVLDLRR